ncbi:hypothetical protein V493_05744 [Pseudogymnoascus sp. VKM F-4281 (FW-2241)]|nr:hypothetical protein V493_05744 [Pseudogymnoascus sp. VKM F-4281 (FW-2241)]
MSDSLYELLAPHLSQPSTSSLRLPSDPVTSTYLTRLTTLPLSSLSGSEPQSLAQTSHSLLLSLQALSSRSHKAVIASSDHLSSLQTTLPAIAESTTKLQDAIPKLDEEALRFATTYNKNTENAILDRRRKALLLSRNSDRLGDVLELPTLLSSAISTSGATSSTNNTSSSATVNYASALDLNAHIRRLHSLYPESRLVSSVTLQAEEEMQAMTTNLISSLKAQGLKLAAAMRTISWLRRIAPELDTPGSEVGSSHEGSLGGLFLVCRLANLMAMLGALEPLRELADQELSNIASSTTKKDPNTAWSGGQQTERYLKRYIEIFREQSFAIISMFRSIFPAAAEGGLESLGGKGKAGSDPLQPLSSSLSTFPLHLVGVLLETLKKYLPNVQDRATRDSLLTQVLYCAASLGRLGGDFSMILTFLEEEGEDTEEWVDVIRKHRVLAGKLESMVGARESEAYILGGLKGGRNSSVGGHERCSVDTTRQDKTGRKVGGSDMWWGWTCMQVDAMYTLIYGNLSYDAEAMNDDKMFPGDGMIGAAQRCWGQDKQATAWHGVIIARVWFAPVEDLR